LFWLSLIPFGTAWQGETHFASAPVALYGVVLLLAALAYNILTRALLVLHGSDSFLATAIGRDIKGQISLALYVLAIPLSFLNSWLAWSVNILVAVIWLFPDRRIERSLAH
jgi:uncharacterized membrane protein